MRWLVGLTLALALCAATSVASADGYYFTEGFGATSVKDDLATYMPSAMNFRVAVGRRRGHFATELFMQAHLNSEYADTQGLPPSLTTGGLAVKYIEPVSPHLELYLRGSATLGSLDESLKDYSGRGLGFGAGIQYKGRGSVWGLLWYPLFWLVKDGPKMTGAIWVEDGYEYYRLHGPLRGDVINAQLTHITAGIAVGSDF
jgi:hypothetical protein